MTAAPEVLVAGKGLHTYYGYSHVLHGVDFSVRAGETVCLMGRNGMGKTTLLRTLLGHVRARRGTVHVRGEDMTQARTSRIIRKGIAYVPEGRGIFANLTVREHLVMAARPGFDGRNEWTIERVLASFPRLSERLTSQGTNLSGGEQQMLAIGRALLTNPDLLILDEATEGLAPLIRQQIWFVVHDIKETGIATIIVDKNVDVLLDLSDRATIMVKGEIVYDGDCDTLRHSPDILNTHVGI
ncbi:MAG: ABC transporter ATP-binding protein [Xanthobacteraceae bacterium]|nr:MAG: ABC transporter ATP-binding protein [Xanthobacteraceae bacterium]